MTTESRDDKINASSGDESTGSTPADSGKTRPASGKKQSSSAKSRPFSSPLWREKISPVLKTLAIITVILLIIAGCALAYTLNYLIAGLPDWDPEKLGGDNTSFIYDANGNIIDSLHGEQNRIDITVDQVPRDLINAFVATEDQSFYDHHGFNVRGIARALYYNFIGDNPYAQGASTITQQLARNAFLSPDKTWERKGKELILAIKIERNYSKDEIMEMYLNKIYFGAGAYGAQAAAMTFFSKSASDLTLPECAFLAGLVQSPSFYNPFLNYDAAKVRQRDVLNNMVSCGFLTAAQADEAYAVPVVLNHTQSTVEESVHGFYRDAVIDEAVEVLGENQLFADPENAVYRAGLHIYTAMEPDLQSYIEQEFADDDNFPGNAPDGSRVQSSTTVVENSTGEIKALMGGREYGALRGFNRATSGRRQPGSSIKPITVYSPALEKGYSPDYYIEDRPIMYTLGGENWKPENVSKSYMGSISMDTAVTYSVNTYAVQLLDKIGIDYSMNFAQTLGLDLVDSGSPNDFGLAPLGLGGLTRGVTTKEMAGAYSTFGNGGVFNKPHVIRKIVDRKGTVIYEYNDGQQVMSAQSAKEMVGMLQHVVSYGTGTRAKVDGVPTGGKTGTSESYADSWFVGLTPTFSCAVWMGYDVDYHMGTVYGGTYPAQLFRKIMTKAHENYQDVEWVAGNENALVTRVDPIEETHDPGKVIYLAVPDEKKDEKKPGDATTTTPGTNQTPGNNNSTSNNSTNSSSNSNSSSSNSSVNNYTPGQ